MNEAMSNISWLRLKMNFPVVTPGLLWGLPVLSVTSQLARWCRIAL